MLLDIGVGILAALGIGELLHIPITGWWIATGILFALLPDIDAIIYFARYRDMSQEHHHRDLLHIPLLFIPVGTTLLYLFSPALALLFAICALVHFIHDSIGVGWGIQWLRPFNDDHFSFLYLYQPAGKPHLPKRLLYRLERDKIDEIDAEFGDHDWIRNVYLRFHPYAIAEYAVFVAALLALYIAK